VDGYVVPVFYDSMIAKLITWAASREEAVLRMSRALGEYQVLGIRTTIPFFLWLMRQPDYLEGRFDTTYLDRLLAARRGESFTELSEREEEYAAIAAALDTFLRASRSAGAGAARTAVGLWKQAARREALRG
jgi:acetyl/propionyl-CoA carboxylase alpha subunit